MSQRDGFTGGFILGSLVGGVVGGILGTLVASRAKNNSDEEAKSLLKPSTQAQINSEESIEFARRSLEDKIAQLNLAIDDVRQQLGAVNGNTSETE